MRYRSNLILICLFSASVAAQRLPFVLYSEANGLPQDIVMPIFQDSKGFMWFGSQAGLCRYDGQSFHTFTVADGLRDNTISFITEDMKGRIRIATTFAGCSILEGDSIESFLIVRDTASSANHINSIFQYDDSTMWFATQDGVYESRGHGFRKLFTKNPLLRVGIREMFRDSRGRIWIGKDDGLIMIQRGVVQPILQTEGLPDPRIISIVEDGMGCIWIATEHGVCTFDESRGVCQAVDYPPLRDAKVYSATRDHAGNIWFGIFNRGAVRFHPMNAQAQEGTWKHLTQHNGLAHDDVFDILQDREGVLWFATRNGVNKLANDSFEIYSDENGVQIRYLTSVAVARDGTLWMGTNSGVVHFTGKKFIAYPLRNGREGRYVTAVLTDSRNRIWIGAENGLFVCENNTIRLHTKLSVRDDIARSLFEDHLGRLWVGTRHGTYCINGRSRKKFWVNEGMPRSLSIAIHEAGGCIWVGTETDGIVRLQLEGDRIRVRDRITNMQGLVHNFIRCVYKDLDGNLWFGTRLGGVSKFSISPDGSCSIKNYTMNDGLLGNAVRSVFQDSKRRYWISTGKGVDIYDGNTFRHITVRDGLAGDWVFFTLENSDGSYWIGSNSGLTHYTPPTDNMSKPPLVYIMSCKLFGKTVVPLDSTASFSSDQHSLTFQFVSPSFRNEAKVLYQFLLEGTDTSWSAPTSNSMITYSHLTAGSYRFRVRSINADGVVSVTPASFSFTIASPWWVRWWFVSGISLAVLGSISLLYRIRVRRLLELERLRLRIATDLHDEVGSTLSSISMFSEVAKRLAQESAPDAAEFMQRIGENARSVINALRDIVWAINPENDALDRIFLHAKEFAVQLFEAHGIAFDIDIPVEDSSLKMSLEKRRHFMLIFKEAVNNIVKHAESTHARIAITLRHGSVSMVIEDNGGGCNPSSPSKFLSGNGLKNMRHRAQVLHADFQFHSEIGKGTSISLRMKIT